MVEKVPNDANCHPQFTPCQTRCKQFVKDHCFILYFHQVRFILLLCISYLSEKGPPVVRSPSQVIMVPCVLG